MSDFGAPPLMRIVPEGDAALVRSLAVRRVFHDGEIIHDRGDPDAALGIVVRGRVKLDSPRSDGRDIFVTFVNPDQHWGDTTLIESDRRSHRATAIGETEIDQISKDEFPRLLERPAIVQALYRVAAWRMTRAVELLNDIRGLRPDARLAKVLLMMHKVEGGAVSFDYVQEDFANLLGVSSVTLSKALKALRDAGLVETGYRQIALPDAARLRAWLSLHDPD